jgi:hypothetical protein
MPVIPYWIDYASVWGAYAFALALGSAPERIVAGVFSLNYALELLFLPHASGQMLAFDLAMWLAHLALIVALALKFDRWWLLFGGMIQLLSAATSAAGMLHHVHWWAYGTVAWMWEYLFLGALVSGTWSSWRSRRRPVGAKAAQAAAA